jgi:hypothetical protein
MGHTEHETGVLNTWLQCSVFFFEAGMEFLNGWMNFGFKGLKDLISSTCMHIPVCVRV